MPNPRLTPPTLGKEIDNNDLHNLLFVLFYSYGYPYAYAGVPFGSSTGNYIDYNDQWWLLIIIIPGLDPITQGLDAATQGYVPYYGYGHYAYGHYYGKRSAEAEADPEADPALFYGAYGYPYGKFKTTSFSQYSSLLKTN